MITMPFHSGETVLVAVSINGARGPHNGVIVNVTRRGRVEVLATVAGRQMTIITDRKNVHRLPDPIAPALPRETDPDVEQFDREADRWFSFSFLSPNLRVA
jgi:hypothetical protein